MNARAEALRQAVAATNPKLSPNTRDLVGELWIAELQKEELGPLYETLKRALTLQLMRECPSHERMYLLSLLTK